MKKTCIFIFYVFQNIIIAQINSNNNLENTINYDSITNVSKFKTINETILIGGEWFFFNNRDYLCDVFVSHTPILINEDNIIAEIGKFDENVSTNIFGIYKPDDIHRFTKKIIKHIGKRNIISEEYNSKKNYYLLKTSTTSKVKKDTLITSYRLIGIKNKYTYLFAIQNFDESKYSNLEDFLISVYDLN